MKGLKMVSVNGMIQFRQKRTDYAEMLQSFAESKLPKVVLVFEIYKMLYSLKRGV